MNISNGKMMNTYLASWPGWLKPGHTCFGKVWLSDGQELAVGTMQDYVIRRAQQNCLRAVCVTYKGLERLSLPTPKREPAQEPVEPTVLDDELAAIDKLPVRKTELLPAPELLAEIEEADPEQPFGRTAKCRRCPERPCLLTEQEVAALPYREKGDGREVCAACKRKQQLKKLNEEFEKLQKQLERLQR